MMSHNPLQKAIERVEEEKKKDNDSLFGKAPNDNKENQIDISTSTIKKVEEDGESVITDFFQSSENSIEGLVDFLVSTYSHNRSLKESVQ